MYQLDLQNKKYTIILNEDPSNFIFRCDRHFEDWRDLTGDNMVLALVYRIQNLEEKLRNIENHLVSEGFRDPNEIISTCIGIARESVK